MEVKGSVIIGDSDHEPQVHGGFADLDQPVSIQRKDNVPRILVQDFKKQMKPIKLYSVFKKFGTLTYIIINEQNAVLEFSSKDAVGSILKCPFIKIEGSKVEIKPLEFFVHAEPKQLEFRLHAELSMLTSVAAFESYVEDIVCKSKQHENAERDQKVCAQLEKAVRAMYPSCCAHTFGSRRTGLGLADCDLDVFLDCAGMYAGNTGQESEVQENLLENTCRELLRHNDFTKLEKVVHARVPILQFFHAPTNTYGDIAFRHGLGCENSRLLVFLLSLDIRLKPLLLFLKKWAYLQGIRKMSPEAHFTSYALVMMAVFYLQQLPSPILPPIQKLVNAYKGPPTVVAGWVCSFSEDRSLAPAPSQPGSMLQLAKGFFRYYQAFDFDRFAICPFLGLPIHKNDLATARGLLQAHFQLYTQLVQQGGAERLRTHCTICVQDPFEHNHNLTRNVKDEKLMRFISSCGLMHEQLDML